MTTIKFLVLKYNETDWDIVSKSGQLAYSYLDEEYGHMKIQRYKDPIKKPVFTYDGLLEQLALGDSYIDDLVTYSQMNAEIFEETAKDLTFSKSSAEFEVSLKMIPTDSQVGWENIAKAFINEFLFGNTQKASCPKCAKEQVFAKVREKGNEVKMCTECRSIL